MNPWEICPYCGFKGTKIIYMSRDDRPILCQGCGKRYNFYPRRKDVTSEEDSEA